MRKRGSKGFSVVMVLVFVAAFVLAFLALRFLPIPEEWKRLVFFALIPIVSFVGVLVAGIVAGGKLRMKSGRRGGRRWRRR